MRSFSSQIEEKDEDRQRIAAQIKAYLASGGTITQIPRGHMAKDAEDSYSDRRRGAENSLKLRFSYNASSKDRNLTH